MASIFFNGGIIGTTLDYGANNSNDRYILSYTPTRDTLVFVGGQNAGYSGTTSTSTINFNLAGGVSTTPAANDLVILSTAVAANSNLNSTLAVAGYTTIAEIYAPDTQSTDFYVAYKLMGTTPDTSFTRPATGNTQHSGAYAVQVWRNVDQNTPFDVTSTVVQGLNTAIPNPPAITPTTTNTQIVVAAGAAHLRGAQSFTASYLNNFRTSGGDDNVDSTVGIGNVAWTSGSYDPAAWTFSGADSTAYSYAAVTMAIRPKLVDIPTFGNLKNSGIWNLEAQYEYKRSQTIQAGQIAFPKSGTTLWKVPPGVTNVAAICIGAGGGGSGGDGGRGTTNGGGGGGGCAWGNFDVTPGEFLTVVVGGPGTSSLNNSGTAGGASSISRGATVLLSGGGGGGGIERNAGTASGGTSTGTVRQGGGSGGNGGTGAAVSGATGGGGAGGLFGNGGNGGAYNANGSNGPTNGYGGAGGAGVAGTDGSLSGGGGGNIGYGTDFANIRATTTGGVNPGGGGQGTETFGSADGFDGTSGGLGGYYGGGGGAVNDAGGTGGVGGPGLVYILWGPNRSYPSSNTVDVTT